MASRVAVELRGHTDGELVSELEEAHQELFNLRFQASTRQLANVAQVSRARRRVARIKTLLRERAILEEAGALNPTEAATAASDTADALAGEEE